MQKCIVCGKEFESCRYRDIKGFICDDECFNKNFWTDLYEKGKATTHKCVVVDGTHYIIGPEEDRGFRGFSGRKFVIRFFDGTEVTTTNLWHQGHVPERFKDMFPNNAEFIN